MTKLLHLFIIFVLSYSLIAQNNLDMTYCITEDFFPQRCLGYDVSFLNDGSVIVSWAYQNPESNKFCIYIQPFDNTYHKKCEPILISDIAEDYTLTKIIPLNNSDFILFWGALYFEDNDAKYRIFAQKFYSNGDKISESKIISDIDHMLNTQQFYVFKFPNDEIGICWNAFFDFNEMNEFGIYLQIIDENLQKEFTSGHFICPRTWNNDLNIFAVNNSQLVLIDYQTTIEGETSYEKLSIEIVDTEGNQIKELTGFSEDAKLKQFNGIESIIDDESYVIVWQERPIDVLDYDIWAQKYSIQTHEKHGEKFRINRYTDGHQAYPCLNKNADGFIISYLSKSLNGNTYTIKIQMMDNHFDFQNDELTAFDVSSLLPGGVTPFKLIKNRNSEYSCCWMQNNSYSISGDIYARFFTQLHADIENFPPQIVTFSPAADTVITEGDSLEFFITVLDEDNDTLFCTWYYDEKIIAIDTTANDTSTIWVHFPYGTAGTHSVKTLVTDGELITDTTWKFTVTEIATGVPNDDNAPREYLLNQNYPNPFNPVTYIRFGLPTAGEVQINLFNIQGKKVKTLLNTYKSAGYYVLHFDGRELTGGIYFYKIQSGKFSEIKKMILLK
ncbi:T9SS type A sorting domain-containing protein [bacterium]|nr:T9SS type A sorting domain-containing protein [bacterium]